MLEQSFEIAKTNWKHNLVFHFLIAVLLCLMAPVIMGTRNLNEMQVAKIIEMYMGFLGVILLIPLFLPDANSDIRDLIASKKIPVTIVRMIRLIQATVILCGVLAAFLYVLKCGNCSFDFERCFYAAIANCVALGGFGLLFFSITDQVVIAYMMPLIYYIVSIGGGQKYLKVFSLMSFSAGRIEDKKYILVAGVVCILVSLLIKWKRRA